MAASLGTFDFFLLEGGEYLDRLDTIAQAQAGAFAHGEEFVRLARAFRGSAIMANQHGMARAGQGLESVARGVRESRLAWDEGVRGEVTRALDDCRVLIRRLRTPDQGDTEKAEQIGIRLDRLSGRASAAMRAAQGPGLDAGGRAFVAREAAAIGSVLQHTARSVAADPSNRDALFAVVPAMSALRGVAVLNDLPPLGDILMAIDACVKEVTSARGPAAREVPEVFEAGARALARAAREVVDAGRPDPDSEEARGFAARLLAAVAASGSVPVETLFFDDPGPHVLQAGTPLPQSSLGRVEIVSHGEFLTAAATELDRSTSAVQRDLRLFGIAANLRPLAQTSGSEVPARALAEFAEAVRGAIGGGAASVAPSGFVAAVKEAAAALTGMQSGDEAQLAARLARTTLAIGTLQPEEPVAAPAEPPAAAVVAAPVRPEAAPTDVAPRAAPAAPVEAPAPPPAPRITTARRTAPPVPDAADLAISYLTLEQLISERGMPGGSLIELLSGGTGMVPGYAPSAPPPAAAPAAPAPAAEAGVVPVESLAPDEVVDVATLLYSGEGALRRILELRPQLAAAAASRDQRIDDLLNEVFDLVELGLGAGR